MTLLLAVMGKKKKKSGRVISSRPLSHPGRSLGGVTNSDRIVPLHVRFNISSSASSLTGGTVVVNQTDFEIANFGARAVSLADNFTFFRIVKFRFTGRAHPGASTTPFLGYISWYCAVAFAPKSGYTAPTTIPQMLDFPHLSWTQDFSPNRISINIGRSELLGAMPYEWLKTTHTGVNDEDYVQLSFVTMSQPYQTLTLAGLLEGVCDLDLEFRGDVDPALNPRITGERVSRRSSVPPDRKLQLNSGDFDKVARVVDPLDSWEDTRVDEPIPPREEEKKNVRRLGVDGVRSRHDLKLARPPIP